MHDEDEKFGRFFPGQLWSSKTAGSRPAHYFYYIVIKNGIYRNGDNTVFFMQSIRSDGFTAINTPDYFSFGNDLIQALDEEGS